MKKIFALIGSLILMGATSAYAADTSKVAVVNVQQVLLQSTKVAEINTKLQDQFKPRQEKLSAKQKALQDQIDKFAKESATMSQKDRDNTEKQVNEDKANFLKEAGNFQKEVSQEQNKSMQSVIAQLNGIISDLAKKSSYSLVLDSQAVIYTSDATDITKNVAKEFNKK
jgi:outer membrane protein